MIEICKRCGEHESSEVHHIDGDHDNNDPKNLIELCASCHALLEDRAPNLAEAKVQYENLKDLENTRIRLGNRILGLKKWDIDTELLEEEVKTISKLERKVEKRLIEIVKDLEVFKWLIEIRGIAGKTAAKFIAIMGDIARFGKISSLWHYAGLHPKPRSKKNKQFDFNPRLRALCNGIIGRNFIRLRSPYRRLYDEKKRFYEENRDWTKMHKHNAATRYMIKIFLKDLWLKWRKLENLPLTEPHPQDQPRPRVEPNSRVCDLAGGNANGLAHIIHEPLGGRASPVGPKIIAREGG